MGTKWKAGCFVCTKTIKCSPAGPRRAAKVGKERHVKTGPEQRSLEEQRLWPGTQGTKAVKVSSGQTLVGLGLPALELGLHRQVGAAEDFWVRDRCDQNCALGVT